jgi:valyl-tRNA synthetase
MALFMQIVESFRMLKATANLKPSERPPAYIRANSTTYEPLQTNRTLIAQLARIEIPTFLTDSEPKPSGVLSALVRDVELYLVVGEHTLERERARLLAERERLEHLLMQTRSRLANPQFVERAKPEIVERERAKESALAESLEKVTTSLKYISEHS